VVKFLHYLVYFFFYSQTFVREPQSYIKKDHKGERIVVVSHTVGEAAPSAKPPDIAPVSNSRPSQSQSSGLLRDQSGACASPIKLEEDDIDPSILLSPKVEEGIRLDLEASDKTWDGTLKVGDSTLFTIRMLPTADSEELDSVFALLPETLTIAGSLAERKCLSYLKEEIEDICVKRGSRKIYASWLEPLNKSNEREYSNLCEKLLKERKALVVGNCDPIFRDFYVMGLDLSRKYMPHCLQTLSRDSTRGKFLVTIICHKIGCIAPEKLREQAKEKRGASRLSRDLAKRKHSVEAAAKASVEASSGEATTVTTSAATSKENVFKAPEQRIYAGGFSSEHVPEQLAAGHILPSPVTSFSPQQSPQLYPPAFPPQRPTGQAPLYATWPPDPSLSYGQSPDQSQLSPLSFMLGASHPPLPLPTYNSPVRAAPIQLPPLVQPTAFSQSPLSCSPSQRPAHASFNRPPLLFSAAPSSYPLSRGLEGTLAQKGQQSYFSGVSSWPQAPPFSNK
jgi:hypothetical protein